MELARLILPALTLLCACGGCRKTGGNDPDAYGPVDCRLVKDGFGPAGSVPVKVEALVTGLEVPWGLAFVPGGDVLVTERPGRVRLIRGWQLQPDPVANVPIAPGGEGGLLGIALHPDFARTRQFYVYVTTEADGRAQNRVERWTLSEDHRSATFERVIIGDIPPARYHDGGRIRFGPDGMLYVGTGDGGRPRLSQDPDSLAGKLLRLTPDGAVPPDNPFPGKAAFLLGIRNLQGFDWKDPGTLYITDHGPSGDLSRSGHDEVNVVIPGQNLGWPDIYACETRQGLVTPSLTFETAVPPGGAAVYTGSAIPEWKGSLLIGTLRSTHLHRVVFDTAEPRKVRAHEVYLQGNPPQGYGRLRDVLMGPDGHLYVTTSNCDGRGQCPADKDRILRISR